MNDGKFIYIVGSLISFFFLVPFFLFVIYFAKWPGRNVVMLLHPLFFCGYYLLKLLIRIKQKNFKVLIPLFLCSVSFFMISWKIQFIYYNVLVYLSFIILIILYLRRDKFPQNTEIRKIKNYILIPICSLLIVLLFIGDKNIAKFKYTTYNIWTENGLSFDDFQGDTDSTQFAAYIFTNIHWIYNRAFSFPQTIVFAVQDPIKSSMKVKNTRLLNHEQLHFDIRHLISKEAQDSVNSRWGSNIEEIYEVMDFYIEKARYVQHAYDSCTNHSIIDGRQKSWDWKIRSQL